MAQAKKPTVTAVPAVVTPKAVVPLSAGWLSELAEAAKNEAAKETPSTSNISFRSGMMSYQGQAVPGNTMPAIVVGTAIERALYDGPFDPNNIKNPVCFALSPDEDKVPLKPHVNSLYPQHETCIGCPMNQWGTAGEGRRGKACKENRRIALIPSDKLESPDDIRAAEVAMAKLPVTSIGNWANYVNRVAAVHSRPTWTVVTQMSVQPHIKNQFEVVFDVADTIDDPDALQALKDKISTVAPFILAPFSMATDDNSGKHPHTNQVPAKAAPPVRKKF